MKTRKEMDHFLEHGYLHAKGLLSPPELEALREGFDSVWEKEQPRVSQHQLLKYAPFIGLIEHPSILDRQRAVFGRQVQLLQYDLLRQGSGSERPDRAWHRDFSFPGDRPLAINTIVYLDEMSEDRGPTRVVPGSHRGAHLPPAEKRNEPLPGEIAVYAKAGDAVFINAAIWHTGGCNRSAGPRRAMYLYYGYWWLKRYEFDRALPSQAFENASPTRLNLLGIRMPEGNLHMYTPSGVLA